mgnify:FL=1
MVSSDLSCVTVVLPSLNPDEKLQKTVASLLAVGFTDLVLVNDGSRADTLRFFPAEDERITVLRHEVNRGKGAALKTAFQYVLDNRPDSAGVVTVDGDGQHRAEDVRRCAETMLADGEKIIFGCRDFSLPHVPRRSRTGNRITSAVFRIFCGLRLSDTQTGLRAIPKKLLPLMLTVPGDRFEYETNMLHEMQAHGIGLAEVKIDTVYIEENKTSHFRPFRDSVRVYSRFLMFIGSSAVSFLLDALLMFLFLTLAEKLLSVHFENESTTAVAATAACKACARIVSALFNFTLNRKKVFGAAGNTGRAMLRYFILAACILLVSSGATALGKLLFGLGSTWQITLLGVVVDCVLFIASFRIQQAWVFKKEVEKQESQRN